MVWTGARWPGGWVGVVGSVGKWAGGLGSIGEREREKRREERGDMRGRRMRDESGCNFPCVMWMSRLPLTVILILFDYFNGLSHSMN